MVIGLPGKGRKASCITVKANSSLTWRSLKSIFLNRVANSSIEDVFHSEWKSQPKVSLHVLPAIDDTAKRGRQVYQVVKSLEEQVVESFKDTQGVSEVTYGPELIHSETTPKVSADYILQFYVKDTPTKDFDCGFDLYDREGKVILSEKRVLEKQ